MIIIGHKNPDTDSVVSAISYASLKKQLGEEAEARRSGELNKETKFVLGYLNVSEPELAEDLSDQKVIILDHGDLSQSVKGIESSMLMEVIDHHYLGGIKTEKPILYRAEPVGSTSTIILKLFKEKKVSISKQDASLLLAGIASDTLSLASPTTTSDDLEAAKELEIISGINLQELAQKMFEAKSDLTGVLPEEIVSEDAKEFEFDAGRFGISVFETVGPEKVNALKEDIFKAMMEFKAQHDLKFFFFFVVDILKGNSFLYLLGFEEEEAAKKAFNQEMTDRIVFLEGVVSRKKQMLPQIAESLK